MKKIYVFLFFIMTFMGFANQSYDDAKFRQDLVNWASSKVGANYDMNNRWGSNTFDCSSLVSRAIGGAGMTSISGKKSDYGTTASGLYQSSGKIISKTDYNSLKPGDIVHFSPYSSGTTGHVGIVVANLGNGKVKLVDARGKAYGVVRRVVDLSQNSHYLGATSATQILINNGYTPVNTDGSVVAPAGSTVPGTSGSVSYTPAKMVEQQYTIDLDMIAKQYIDGIKLGIENLGIELIPFLSALFLLDLTYYLFKKGLQDIFQELVIRFCKFAFFLFVFDNAYNLIDVMYQTFIGIAEYWGGFTDLKIMTFFDIMTSYLLVLLNAIVKIKLTTILFDFNGTIAMCLLLVVFAVMIAYSFFRLMLEMFSNTLFFFLATAISLCLFSLKISKLTDQFGSNPINVAVTCGIKIILTFVLLGVAVKILGGESGVLLAEIDINNVDLVGILTITIYLFITCTLVKRINNLIQY